MKSYCGLDCSECSLKTSCSGCTEVTDLNALQGAYINLQYTLPGGQEIRFWEDDRVYLGNQICKKNSERCYGLTADENYLLVCEYGPNGSDAQIVLFKKRR